MNDAGRGQTLAPLPTVRATGTLLAAPRGSGRLPSPLVPGPSVVPRRSGRQSSALEPLCGGLGPQLPRGRWPPGPVSSRRPRQSLDAQPEQLALRPKEFFRAHGIEVLTEAQVRTRRGSRLGRASWAPWRAGVRPLEVWVCSAPLCPGAQAPRDAPGLRGS